MVVGLVLRRTLSVVKQESAHESTAATSKSNYWALTCLRIFSYFLHFNSDLKYKLLVKGVHWTMLPLIIWLLKVSITDGSMGVTENTQPSRNLTRRGQAHVLRSIPSQHFSLSTRLLPSL